MKNTFISIAALAAFVLPLAALAEDESLVEVVATGHGSTVREAAKASLRAAVEQVVGTMVDATTLVKNDELIENEILTYAPGIVEKATQIGEPKKSADGIFTVKIKATVKKTALKEKLVASKIVSVNLDGQSLWAQAASAEENLANAEAMIKNVLAKHISCIVYEAVSGKNGKGPLIRDPKSGEVFANIRVSIDQMKYRQFVKEVLDKLGPMASRKVRMMSKGSSDSDYKYCGDGYFEYYFNQDKPDYLLVMENLRSGSASVFWFDKNKMEVILASMDTGSIALSVSLQDASGEEMTSALTVVNKREDDEDEEGELSMFCRAETNGLIVPLFGDYCYVNDNGSYVSEPGKVSKSLRVSLGKFTADELKSAGKLEIKVGHMKDGQFTE